MRIVIDPGHGGWRGDRLETGAKFTPKIKPGKSHIQEDFVGGETFFECNIVLEWAYSLKEALEKQKIDVVLTRTAADHYYIPSAQRVKVAGQIFISLHCNSSGQPPKRAGFECYIKAQANKIDTPERILASYLTGCAERVLPGYGSGLRPYPIRSDSESQHDGLYVLQRFKGTAVLLELGFLNHPADRAAITDPDCRKDLCIMMADAIKDYVNEFKLKEDLKNAKK